MKIFIKYLKNIITAVVFIAALIITGILNINTVSELEARRASYVRTTFNVAVSSPGVSQLDEINSYSSVEKVFPVYRYMNAFGTTGKLKDVDLLLSDKMEESEIFLFNGQTLVSGKFDKDGVMLDYNASNKLGLGAGDKISFTVRGVKTEKTVSGVFLSSTYGSLTGGVVLAAYPAALENARPNAYGAAYILSNDVSDTQTKLSGYVGEGSYDSFEKYLKNYNKRQDETQEDFEARYLPQYEAYRAGKITQILADKNNGQVTLKADLYAEMQGRVNTLEKRVSTMNLLVTIASAVLYAIVNVIFMCANRGNDRIKCDSGMSALRMFAEYALAALVTAAVIAAVSVAVLITVSYTTFFAAECLTTVLLFSLSAAMAVPAVLIASLIYVMLLYKNSAR